MVDAAGAAHRGGGRGRRAPRHSPDPQPFAQAAATEGRNRGVARRRRAAAARTGGGGALAAGGEVGPGRPLPGRAAGAVPGGAVALAPAAIAALRIDAD